MKRRTKWRGCEKRRDVIRQLRAPKKKLSLSDSRMEALVVGSMFLARETHCGSSLSAWGGGGAAS